MDVLRDELVNDPMHFGYADYLPASPGFVADLMNLPTASGIKSRYITARTILADCEHGADILDAIEAAAKTNSAARWALGFLGKDSGFDIGHPRSQAAVGEMMSEELASELRWLALQPVSRAEQLGITVTEQDVVQAWLKSAK